METTTITIYLGVIITIIALSSAFLPLRNKETKNLGSGVEARV